MRWSSVALLNCLVHLALALAYGPIYGPQPRAASTLSMFAIIVSKGLHMHILDLEQTCSCTLVNTPLLKATLFANRRLPPFAKNPCPASPFLTCSGCALGLAAHHRHLQMGPCLAY